MMQGFISAWEATGQKGRWFSKDAGIQTATQSFEHSSGLMFVKNR